jgi:NAD(P)-dependent dehydrogenase (short-subunit alcohol dehydrogenase family)
MLISLSGVNVMPDSDEVVSAKSMLERFRLDGRTAMVTGGGSGIGRAFCHALGEAGAAIAVVDISGESAETVAGELAGKNIDAIAVEADVTDQEQIDNAIDTVVNHWSRLTIGVNNAGIGSWVNAEDITSEDWYKVMRLNLDAVFFCAQAEGKVMRKNCYGKIINTASMSAHIVNTPQNQVPYNTSKAGVLHMTRSLAAEWAPKGIRVNSISPGYTRTKLVEDLVATPEGKAKMDRWLPLIPMGRLAEVTDLQGAVVFLAADASDYMTGQDIIIDGGYCLW